ncbi:PHA/PHB synthase family protein [Legionella septentrionalis]|uniref:Class I poly(R)-hydroxyalkanoic acid synthase n=1 Tax=Legionella septentrionalis TaxID=2498109 RepID=A0A433JLF3_9GAMM|nr:class I poly(R)-hydroxyalkanoic acid synthase [Legionella septentrionalis]RUQ90387.1 class I poly(R)-hydroxyalkanoic acid synthase [Legionella septentrionalis]
MFQDKELSELMQSIAEKSLRLLASFKEQPQHLSMFFEKIMDLFKDVQATAMALNKNPQSLWQMQIAYCHDAATLLYQHLESWQKGQPMPIQDKRFSSEEWVNNPFFNLLSQQYLLAAEHLKALLEQLEYSGPVQSKRVRFFARQYLDALSPDNFLHTNPQLLAETMQSQGKNLLRGLQNFLDDLEAGSSRLSIKMTDTSAFKIGENLAVTPGNVIYKNELMELIQYTAHTRQVKSIPLLIIPPWINKYYILDLSQENSLIRWLVSQGITVFVISWVNPGRRFAHKGLNEYLHEGPLTAIRIIQQQLNVKQVNALGFCIGGTLLAMLLAYLKAHQDDFIRSATFLASMIDFSDPGDIAVFIDEEQLCKLEEKMNQQGYLDGHFMANAFNSLRASDLIWSFFIKNYLRGRAPVPFDILFWNADSTNMPAKMHSQYLRWMYLCNDLIKPGKIHLNHIPLDMTQITVATFFVATQKDHIAPWKTIYEGFKLFKGEKHFLLGGSGHIAGIIIPPGGEKYGFYTNSKAPEAADDWLKQATHHRGSWWATWFQWLNKKSGRLRNTPNIDELPYKSIEKAPGEYVYKSAKPVIAIEKNPSCA